jgi:hypothetical protein
VSGSHQEAVGLLPEVFFSGGIPDSLLVRLRHQQAGMVCDYPDICGHDGLCHALQAKAEEQARQKYLKMSVQKQ